MGFGREEWRPRRSGVGSAPAARCQFGTWLAGRASQAGSPGRGGCERARPLRARSASRASRGRLRREAPGEPAASVLPPAELCAAAVAAAPSPTCWWRRDKEGEGEEGGGAGGGGASPLLPPAPTSRGLRSPQLSACTRPPPPARPGLPSTPRRPLLQPRQPGPARPARPPPPGAAGEFEASAGRAAPPRCAREPPRRPSPAEQTPARSGRPERASEKARRAPERGGERARKSEPESERREQTPCRAGRRISPSACRRKSRREVSEATGRGKAGKRGPGQGPPPVPPSPSAPPDLSTGRRGRGAAPSGAAGGWRRRRANWKRFLWGGGSGRRGKRGGAAAGNFSLGERFFGGVRRGYSSFSRARSHVEPRASVCGVGAGGGSCSVLSDFSNFPSPAAAFAVSPPLAGLPWCYGAQSCWRFSEEEEQEEEELGGGKWALPQVSGGGGEEGNAVPRLRVWDWE